MTLENGQVVFTPAPNYNGPASFTYTITDSNGATDTATVTVTVHPVNDVATIAGPGTGSVKEDVTPSTGGTLTVTDADEGESENGDEEEDDLDDAVAEVGTDWTPTPLTPLEVLQCYNPHGY